ncbi:hypothetical protein [Hymenobacter terrenus]|uniref:hypothetical protein n=1 Tax=Hymenobacter terrenus TaxID=1629124 RepID=UPI000619720B|nr:hypothetical protein [Hymenobacter terrenus]
MRKHKTIPVLDTSGVEADFSLMSLVENLVQRGADAGQTTQAADILASKNDYCITYEIYVASAALDSTPLMVQPARSFRAFREENQTAF